MAGLRFDTAKMNEPATWQKIVCGIRTRDKGKKGVGDFSCIAAPFPISLIYGTAFPPTSPDIFFLSFLLASCQYLSSFPDLLLSPFLIADEHKNVAFTALGFPNCFEGTKVSLTQQLTANHTCEV